jgi:predicted membrane-bound spermidine synthase
VAGLLFCSGACALVFQVAWFREFRLVFGASTAASAAVLAIFMGGLGLGNALLGRRADRAGNPLAFYAGMELAVAATTALTPFLVDLGRSVYVALGGQSSLGFVGATIVRLALSSLVLGAPTVLMGGTLPAAARAVTSADDPRRRNTAILYGVNTLGAVAGSLLSTFLLIEVMGTRTTLWAACGVNLLISLAAFALSRRAPALQSSSRPLPQRAKRRDKVEDLGPLPARLVYATAGIVGFAFFLMELVWYRMLAPLLGGSTFTFGLILAVALAGIGLGGAAYAVLFAGRMASRASLALTCGLEALLIALPLWLGDEIALAMARFQAANTHGFLGEVVGWAAIAAMVILPAALVSGLQFPLLIASLGRGDDNLGRQVGLTVAWNTAGAIGGSLAGGFGLLPLLSAPGVWRGVVVLLAVLSAALAVESIRREGSRFAAWLPWGAAILAVGLLFATGPTAVWRHSGIGAERAHIPLQSVNELHNWMNTQKRRIVWEADGIESSVAIGAAHGLAFIVNGKTDGNAISDAPTQIMLGLTGALLHPKPQTVFVVGLGTGETAGWLAEIPSAERVDVVELEPAIDEMARRCSAVNFNVLHHPKVRRIYNDAREVLLTSPQRYDLIVSEPSNPYRSGIASLFTREFYLAGRDRLNDGGLFVQWVQGYEIDSRTFGTICATLRSVYSQVEIWQTGNNDLLLVASMKPLSYSAAGLRHRIGQEPFRSALAFTFRCASLEGLLARYVGGQALVDHCMGHESINTDDHNTIEYGFARSLGQQGKFHIHQLRHQAAELSVQRPALGDSRIDWETVDCERTAMYAVLEHRLPPEEPRMPVPARYRKALECYLAGDWPAMTAAWEQQARRANSPTELALLAFAYAQQGDAKAMPLVSQLRAFQPTEATAILGVFMSRKKRLEDAADMLALTFLRLRNDPWALREIAQGALDTAILLVQADRRQAPKLWAEIQHPFAVGFATETRRGAACWIASQVQASAAAECMASFEPNVLWTRSFLHLREKIYTAAHHPLAAKAAHDRAEFSQYDSEGSSETK